MRGVLDLLLLLVADFGLDTIYSVKNKQWAPFAVKVNRLTPQKYDFLSSCAWQYRAFLYFCSKNNRP